MTMTEIYDIHPHIISGDLEAYPKAPLRGVQSDWSKERPLTFDDLVAQMDEAGVRKAAIVQSSTFYGYDNSYLADSIARMPERFTGVGSVDVLGPDAVDRAREWLDRGITGLRLFTAGSVHDVDADWLVDPRGFPTWEFCAEHAVPMCIQTTPVGLPQVVQLLERFPDVDVILDHCARPKFEDGPPYAQARTLFELSRYANLFIKITPRTFALSRKGAATPATLFPRLVSEFGADRIAFGSNIPSNEGTLSDAVADAKDALSSLSAADRAMIFSGTAKRLYPALDGATSRDRAVGEDRP